MADYSKQTSVDVAYLRKRLSYDPTTGDLTWLHHAGSPPKWNGKFAGRKAGSFDNYGYVKITLDAKQYKAHRIAWALMQGVWPTFQIDHTDGNRANNRWGNLREATIEQNLANSRIRSDNRYGIKGVCLSRGKWIAQLSVNKRYMSIGRFGTKEQAATAYRLAALEHCGEFANPDRLDNADERKRKEQKP